MASLEEIRGALAQKRDTARAAGVSSDLATEASSVGRTLPTGAAERQKSQTMPVDSARLRSQRILAPDDTSPAGQAFKILRTQVLQMLRREGYSSLAIVSPSSGDGRTVTAINLAISVADDPDHTALLVDLDLRRPSVAKRLGLYSESGVESVLEPTGDVGAVMVRLEGYPRLALLPAAQSVAGSTELLGSEATRRAAREINGRYANRIVIYDLPPLLETAHAIAFLPSVDAVLLVVRERVTRREDVVRSLQLLRDKPVVGTVLTGSRESRGL